MCSFSALQIRYFDCYMHIIEILVRWKNMGGVNKLTECMKEIQDSLSASLGASANFNKVIFKIYYNLAFHCFSWITYHLYYCARCAGLTRGGTWRTAQKATTEDEEKSLLHYKLNLHYEQGSVWSSVRSICKVYCIFADFTWLIHWCTLNTYTSEVSHTIVILAPSQNSCLRFV
mgnify:CR=1 FL=1